MVGTKHEIYEQWFYELAKEIRGEFLAAVHTHGTFNSDHEGYAVILEETDELWDEIKRRTPDKARIQREAIQVAAMAMRLVIDMRMRDEGIQE